MFTGAGTPTLETNTDSLPSRRLLTSEVVQSRSEGSKRTQHQTKQKPVREQKKNSNNPFVLRRQRLTRLSLEIAIKEDEVVS